MTADVQRELAGVTLTHRQVSLAPGEIECACGWVGAWFSRHQAAALLPTVQALIADALAPLLASQAAVERVEDLISRYRGYEASAYVDVRSVRRALDGN